MRLPQQLLDVFEWVLIIFKTTARNIECVDSILSIRYARSVVLYSHYVFRYTLRAARTSHACLYAWRCRNRPSDVRRPADSGILRRHNRVYALLSFFRTSTRSVFPEAYAVVVSAVCFDRETRAVQTPTRVFAPPTTSDARLVVSRCLARYRRVDANIGRGGDFGFRTRPGP